ncbi:MAG: Uma2 family endonuclease [Acidobacteriales bacterium]|nr:Uma2 family endonuclease [Terriglobales bacterium]
MGSQLVTAVATPITFEEFEKRYAGSGRPVEYWHGRVVEKSVPTWLHSVLQAVLVEALRRAGYKTGPEVDLRLSSEFAPRPDVMAGRRSIETRYPTDPSQVEIVVEVLSPDDKMAALLAKCKEYVALGIEQVYVADPESETAWIWNRERGQLDRTEAWTLTNGVSVPLVDVWLEMRERR